MERWKDREKYTQKTSWFQTQDHFSGSESDLLRALYVELEYSSEKLISDPPDVVRCNMCLIYYHLDLNIKHTEKWCE